ncbi:uncharacterized protein LOC141899522 [Tubulanus polymorphus]|uniref:uncharacterized protein LOC141899522 n=1 Tax=Tubulanus polymorphus TaxID=672921 RepID=UPI003DA68F20
MTKTRRTATVKKDSVNKAQHSMNPDRTKGAGGNNMRDRTTINRLKMYKNFKPVRDRSGKIIKAAPFQSKLPSGTVARVAPNRKWFGNTRVIGQAALQTFQEEMGKVMKDPYKVVMRQTKLPISLLDQKAKFSRMHILETESFENTFGPKSHRKKPKLKNSDMETLLANAEAAQDNYDVEKDRDIFVDNLGVKDEPREMVFRAGQSKRIWNELYKVIDSADVVIQVLDSRDPMGTRCKQVEQYIKKEKSHKHLVFVLNKCDLVPTWVTQKWVALLSSEYPTLAFHASLTNPFGKGAMIQLLRQFGKLHQDKKQISIGFIGYPNVGKSSIINALRSKKVCKVAPIAGETKVWQYVTLMRRIFLIDCPGVVYPTGETESEIILKGVVRVENVKCPDDYIPEVLRRVRREYILKTYKIESWTDHEDFLEQLCRKSGRLLKGGEPDIKTMAKMVLNDWQRGKIPYYVRPPDSEGYKPQKTGEAVKETSTNTPETVQEGTVAQPHVIQDFAKIKVDVEYSGEDIRDLEPVGEVDENVEQTDEEDDDDDDEIAGESSKINESKVIDITQDEDDEVAFMSESEAVNKEKDFDVSNGSNREVQLVTDQQHSYSGEAINSHETTSCESLKKLQVPSHISQKSSKPKLNHPITDSKTCKKMKTASGAFTVTESNSSSKEQEVKQSKKKANKRHGQEMEDEPPQPKLTSKQKRRIEREERQKKIGHHFYSYANVKNRNYDRKDRKQ